jgi:hypothetical protein
VKFFGFLTKKSGLCNGGFLEFFIKNPAKQNYFAVKKKKNFKLNRGLEL